MANRLKLRFNRAMLLIARPFIKRAVKDIIHDYKEVSVNALKETIDIPKLTEEEEAELWTNLYTGLAPAICKIVDRI